MFDDNLLKTEIYLEQGGLEICNISITLFDWLFSYIFFISELLVLVVGVTIVEVVEGQVTTINPATLAPLCPIAVIRIKLSPIINGTST